uniref:Uncharacterized protein n=1 Tax=Oryza sativa subsp. japonica TaxID=39947 RepID=Q6ZGX6_ORYSJ|nr:hypothetical protein [Oryza sativa Japonica Group]
MSSNRFFIRMTKLLLRQTKCSQPPPLAKGLNSSWLSRLTFDACSLARGKAPDPPRMCSEEGVRNPSSLARKTNVRVENEIVALGKWGEEHNPRRHGLQG